MNPQHVIAHRGWQARFPENTLPSIHGAIAAGALHIEIDIQLCADGLPVLCHDPSLQRLCASDRDITQATWSELEKLSVYEPERLGQRFNGTPLSTLAACVELISAYPHVTLYAEIKRHSLRNFGIAKVLDAVLPELQRIENHCVLISFDFPVLQQARECGWDKVAPVLSQAEQLRSADVAALHAVLAFSNKDLFASNATLHDNPLPVALYEISTAAEANDWLQRGAAMIETFDIGTLLQSAVKTDDQ